MHNNSRPTNISWNSLVKRSPIVLDIVHCTCTCTSSDVQYQIVVKERCSRSKITTLEVAFSDTIDAVKAKIQEKERIPCECQELSSAYRELEDGHTLRDYNIVEGTALYLSIMIWNSKYM